jgi:thiaminase/transcriptional activator TenA
MADAGPTTEAAANSGRFSDQLREGAEPFWTAATTHRFTRQLAEGSLPDSVFARYLIQDYHYVDCLAQAVGFAVGLAPDMTARRPLAGFLSVLTNAENDFFLRSFKALGVAEETWRATPPSPVTQAISDAIVGGARVTAGGGQYPEAMTVLLCSEWVYQAWAAPVADARPEQPHYREWIELHATPEFVAFVDWLRAETDRACAGLGAARREKLVALFKRVTELEAAFFEAGFEG